MNYSMMFTKMYGGPCPVCGLKGNLLFTYGVYGPHGQRNLIHECPDGSVNSCHLPHGRGMVYTNIEGWRYEEETR